VLCPASSCAMPMSSALRSSATLDLSELTPPFCRQARRFGGLRRSRLGIAANGDDFQA
jgi:hypothetical protein